LPHIADPIGAVALLSVHAVLLYFGSLYWSFPAILAPKRKSASWRRDEFRGSASGVAIPIITGVILQ